MNLRELLKKHEGLRLKPYVCTAGKLSIGYGRNLDDMGITKEEAEYLLENDIERTIRACRDAFGWFDTLTEARQSVVSSMIFNMGLAGFKKFARTIAHIEAAHYDEAAREMLDSLWAKQVGSRAVELAQMMKEG